MTEQIHPLYVNGPLAGQDHPVDREPLIGPGFGVADADHSVSHGYYNISKWGMAGRDRSAVMVWVAWTGQEPTAQELAEHLLSGQAKAAIAASHEAQTGGQ